MRSFRSIGEELGVHERTAEKIYDRAVLKVRRWLENHPEEVARVKLLLERDEPPTPETELLRVLYDRYGRLNDKVW